MINKIPQDNYIDYTIAQTSLCKTCKSIGLIPCDHKQREFRKKDRFDYMIETMNEIVDYLNNQKIDNIKK